MISIMVDYIVVGTGLAGIAFTEKLAQEGKTFVVIDSEERSSSLIAGGMYTILLYSNALRMFGK
ncbi:UDP-galactopyranose mutase [Myroides gitamensis]|nr:UDP-galactopyranose mutase [Myroides gitamensis]